MVVMMSHADAHRSTKCSSHPGVDPKCFISSSNSTVLAELEAINIGGVEDREISGTVYQAVQLAIHGHVR